MFNNTNNITTNSSSSKNIINNNNSQSFANNNNNNSSNSGRSSSNNSNSRQTSSSSSSQFQQFQQFSHISQLASTSASSSSNDRIASSHFVAPHPQQVSKPKYYPPPQIINPHNHPPQSFSLPLQTQAARSSINTSSSASRSARIPSVGIQPNNSIITGSARVVQHQHPISQEIAQALSQTRQQQHHHHHHHHTSSSSSSSRSPMVTNPLASFKSRKDRTRKRLLDSYEILGYIAAGTYGKVYKAKSRNPEIKSRLFAIKKFKADKEGEIVHYTGISQSACREMALCRELRHKNVINLVEIVLEDKSIFMVFDFAEHDLLQIIHYHTHPEHKPIPESTMKSVLWQILNGVSYLHQNWVLHRDLKPANIMLSSDGIVKIGDLGLARLFSDPIQSFFTGDKVVVTIWYRAPELLLGAKHYTPAIDLWAVGCIFAELLALKPIFKGEEAKMDSKKNIPFQRNQFQKVVDILGTPTTDKWPSLPKYPEFTQFQQLKKCPYHLNAWYQRHSLSVLNQQAFHLLASLFEYDPARRITAHAALSHAYFSEAPRVTENVFQGQRYEYPSRRISNDDNDIKSNVNYTSSTAHKRPVPNNAAAAAAMADQDLLHARKRQK